MKVFSIQVHEGANPYIDDLPGLVAFLETELEENDVGSKIVITTLEMSQEELDALPEWDGP